jgi:DNA-binding protein H-NS
MTGIDLESLSRDKLIMLRKSIDKALETHDARVKAGARAKVEAIARELGFSLAELFEAKVKGKSARGSLVVKFRHPEDPSLTWSGRGRRPQWYNDAVAGGLTPESMAAK